MLYPLAASASGKAVSEFQADMESLLQTWLTLGEFRAILPKAYLGLQHYVQF